MNFGDIEVIPLAAESLGVRSLCTLVRTPDVSIVLDPSAALARRHDLEPHPLEYKELLVRLQKIFAAARQADVLSVSHYHHDHVRAGFTDFQYLLSSKEELLRMVEGKTVLAKHNREHINASQRQRGLSFESAVSNVVKALHWADGRQFRFGSTVVEYSRPLPHGADGSPLGYVLATVIRHGGHAIVFAPDVQGPISPSSLHYLQSIDADMAIIGGPPTYLPIFDTLQSQLALDSLIALTRVIPYIIVDHHLIRDINWQNWLQPVVNTALHNNHRVLTAAEAAGEANRPLESRRRQLYKESPPSPDFIEWTESRDAWKKSHAPPHCW